MSNMNYSNFSLYNKGLSGPIVNQIQNYIYPSRLHWKTVFSNTLEVITRPRDIVLLYETGIMPSNIEYEWVDRLPGLIDVETEEIVYMNDRID